MTSEPVLPDYGGGCVANIVPALLQHAEIGRGWLPDAVLAAKQVVVLVIDGLGLDQLVERLEHTPTMAGLDRVAVTTVAPTTTSTALTSIATGSAPGEHGVVGYKVKVGGEVVNMLRWTGGSGDVSDRVDPTEVQPLVPFLGTHPTVISHRDFQGSSFTEAHLRDSNYVSYWLASSIPVEIRQALDRGERFVYAYYDGIDKIAHITGLGDHYQAELEMVDGLVAAVLDVLPPAAALVVTADHGQVQVGDAIEPISSAVMAHTALVSGEARFVWLHARGGRGTDLLAAAESEHSHHAWVRSVEQILDEKWFGYQVSHNARARLGDVALVARDDIALVDPATSPPMLQSRHGSLTHAEMIVPLITAVV